VRLVRFDLERGREIERLGSAGVRRAPIAAVVEGRVACVRLAPGGRNVDVLAAP
jgi:hypothetical protein